MRAMWVYILTSGFSIKANAEKKRKLGAYDPGMLPGDHLEVTPAMQIRRQEQFAFQERMHQKATAMIAKETARRDAAADEAAAAEADPSEGPKIPPGLDLENEHKNKAMKKGAAGSPGEI